MKEKKQSLLSDKNLPNYISALRIVGTAGLLFIEPFSPAFYVIYTVSGLSDMVDGWIARRMNTTSDLGAKLDSIADLLFYAVMLIRIFPELWIKLPQKIWIAVGAVIFLRICSYILAAVKYRRFAAQHTYLNKATGAVVFAVPYAIALPIAIPFCWGVCVLAALSTAEEFFIHMFSGEYDARRKSIVALWGNGGKSVKR